MTSPRPPLEYTVTAERVDAHGSVARCKSAGVTLDTDLAGRADAFNPAELLLAALSACMIKGIERVTPMLRFQLRGVAVRVHAVRRDVPPKLERIDYDIQVDTDESDARLALLHENVKKFGTVFNTVAPGTELRGVLRRARPQGVDGGGAI
ncbi:MAG TPA: OsmC family protein [Gemmatimonadaceae bacterium]|nr:OsmC family protein [Gemmatimonadaceae bacterium]